MAICFIQQSTNGPTWRLYEGYCLKMNGQERRSDVSKQTTWTNSQVTTDLCWAGPGCTRDTGLVSWDGYSLQSGLVMKTVLTVLSRPEKTYFCHSYAKALALQTVSKYF